MHTRYYVTYFRSATACFNTREHIWARQCQGHCRGQHRQNTDAAPLRACPPPKATHGVLTTRSAIHTAVCFHISHVSARRSMIPTSLLYCDWHSECAAPTQPHRYLSLFTLCLAVRSTLRPSQRRWKPDANPTLPHRLSCLDRPTVQQRKKAGQLTQFSLTGSSTNYKSSALVTVLCQSCSGSQIVTAIQAHDTGQRIKEDLEANGTVNLRPYAPNECTNVPPILMNH